MSSDLSITGVILAGGESRRMGTDKAELLLEGKSFLSRIIGSMRDGFDEILVVGRDTNPSMEYENTYFTTDLTPGQGPLGGLYTGLFMAQSFWCLFVPCDMPFVDSGIYKKLLEARKSERLELIAFEGQKEGVEHFPLLVPKPYLRVVHYLLDLGQTSLRDLFKRSAVAKVSLSWREREALRSFNTPEEYKKLIFQPKEVFLDED